MGIADRDGTSPLGRRHQLCCPSRNFGRLGAGQLSVGKPGSGSNRNGCSDMDLLCRRPKLASAPAGVGWCAGGQDVSIRADYVSQVRNITRELGVG